MAASPDPLMLASLPKVTETELRGLQRECIRLMRLEDDKFPGSQPVSFERRHLTPEDEEATRRGVSLLKQVPQSPNRLPPPTRASSPPNRCRPTPDRRCRQPQEFYAAEKTDGVRYMLLIMGERGAFMVDRNFEMKRLPPTMRFPGHATEGSNPRLADFARDHSPHATALQCIHRGLEP